MCLRKWTISWLCSEHIRRLTDIDGFREVCPNEVWVELDVDGEYNGADEEKAAEDQVNRTQHHPWEYQFGFALKNNAKF